MIDTLLLSVLHLLNISKLKSITLMKEKMEPDGMQ